jgi:hypothetical protein
MDRGVLDALFVAMRLLLVPCVGLIATGCFLNPQGEDPGFEDGNVTNAGDQGGILAPTAGFPDFGPSGSSDSNDGVAMPGAGAPVTTTTVSPGATAAPGPLPTSAPAPLPSPSVEPAPVVPDPVAATGGAGPVGQGGADTASGGAPGGETGGAGGSLADPGEQFDGGPFNYGSPEGDAGPGDAGVDAGDGLIEDTL